METVVTCPHCGKDNENPQSLAGITFCKHCAEWFRITGESAGNSASAPPPPPDTRSEQLDAALKKINQVKSIETQANIFLAVAVVAIVAGVLGLVFTSEDSAKLTWLFSCVGVATWFYLIAQILFIRANGQR